MATIGHRPCPKTKKPRPWQTVGHGYGKIDRPTAKEKLGEEALVGDEAW